MQLKKGSKRLLFFKITEENGADVTVASATATQRDKSYTVLASPTPSIINNTTPTVTVSVMCDTTLAAVVVGGTYYIVLTLTIGTEIFIEQETIEVVL